MTDIIVILVIAVFVLLGVKSNHQSILKVREPAAVAAVEALSLTFLIKKLDNPVLGKKGSQDFRYAL